ncbi:hypothetical protein [Methylophaga sp.]|uniref:hypothetical protein n=1 Tax=Methylophaga sp. TaxID=2024840 RepID=UPI001400DD38|nr:hypothetical protein [Methylophaga sp.]MTI64827.1 hypothetical protein [Methylophaga sp.]
MRTKLIPAALLATSLMTTAAMAEDGHKQCGMIASLTGDYFVQRLEGKTKDQMQQETPPEFINSEFFRIVDLAINLAFSFDESLNEDQVESQVYDSCIRNHP